MLHLELLREVHYQTSRSSGPGGQHVNKTETRVELRWNLYASSVFTDDERSRLQLHLAKRLTADGWLILTSEETRSQVKNKEIVTNRFLMLIEQNLKVQKKRLPTRPTRSSRENRIQSKKHRSQVKANRRKDLY